MKLNQLLKTSGIDIKSFILALKGLPAFLSNYKKIKAATLNSNNEFPITELYPCLSDRFDKAGSLPLHYFYQDVVVAGKVFKNNPVKHVDIGSRIDGFVAHVASFREIEIFDIRSFSTDLPNIKFIKADLTEQNFPLIDYCDSISCLHAIEHFGLGRYGDKLDYNGHIKGLNNIHKVLKTNGKFYFATPIGNQRIEFDAHRVFSITYLLDFFKNKYILDSFSYINDKNELFLDYNLDESNIKNNCGCHYGCGIFELTKLQV
ncbi:MAG: DUF268 domain-containing protein [Ignavibacteria bacterium]|nr:DUF268 domain-containing protein [Ignavibacteria bacterium]